MLGIVIVVLLSLAAGEDYHYARGNPEQSGTRAGFIYGSGPLIAVFLLLIPGIVLAYYRDKPANTLYVWNCLLCLFCVGGTVSLLVAGLILRGTLEVYWVCFAIAFVVFPCLGLACVYWSRSCGSGIYHAVHNRSTAEQFMRTLNDMERLESRVFVSVVCSHSETVSSGTSNGRWGGGTSTRTVTTFEKKFYLPCKIEDLTEPISLESVAAGATIIFRKERRLDPEATAWLKVMKDVLKERYRYYDESIHVTDDLHIPNYRKGILVTQDAQNSLFYRSKEMCMLFGLYTCYRALVVRHHPVKEVTIVKAVSLSGQSVPYLEEENFALVPPPDSESKALEGGGRYSKHYVPDSNRTFGGRTFKGPFRKKTASGGGALHPGRETDGDSYDEISLQSRDQSRTEEETYERQTESDATAASVTFSPV